VIVLAQDHCNRNDVLPEWIHNVCIQSARKDTLCDRKKYIAFALEVLDHTDAGAGSLLRKRKGKKGAENILALLVHQHLLTITAFASKRINLSPFTKACREWDASM